MPQPFATDNRLFKADIQLVVVVKMCKRSAFMLGKPVTRGTRIPLEIIVRKMAEGADQNALLHAYPNLMPQDFHAALRYAADSLAHEEVVLSTAG